MTTWKPISGLEEKYLVSSNGEVRSLRHMTPVGLRGFDGVKALRAHPNGYVVVSLSGDGGKPIAAKVHRLVAEAFIPNPDSKPWVNHINGVKTDNRVENLEWTTIAENHQHAWRTGLQGEKTRRATAKTMRLVNQKRRRAVIAVPVGEDKVGFVFATTHMGRRYGFDQASIALACRGGFRIEPHLYKGYYWFYARDLSGAASAVADFSEA